MAPIAYLTRRECFSACHRLHNPNLSEEDNIEIFLKCNNPNGHGHNYVVEVTVRGPVVEETGMVINVKELKEVMGIAIMKTIDHKNIDKDVPYFANVVSTTENVSIFVWNQLKAHMTNPSLLYEVKIWSTEKISVRYRGESDSD